MGQMRFYAPTPEKLLPHAVELAYVAGLEAVPWRSQNSLVDNVLTIDRTVSESGNLYIRWSIPGVGDRVLSTCTLMERESPYCLTTELARGTLHRIRALVADIQSRGGCIAATERERLDRALAALIEATTHQSQAQERAQLAIQWASESIEALAKSATLTALDEPAEDGALPTILVGRASQTPLSVDLAEQFTAAFHAINVPFRWRELQPDGPTFEWAAVRRQLEWSRSRGLRVIGGPLIQLDHLSLPEWVTALEDDYEQFEAAAINYVRSTVEQCDGQVDVWVCAGRLNVAGALAFTEEQKLRLAVATLEAVRSAASRAPVVISFDQPWAEYLAVEDFDLSPLHFADALVRADLGVAGVALELNLNYWPNGTQPRDLLAISRHMDRWSLLGIPLLVYLTLPSKMGDDPQAVGPAEVVPHSPAEPDRPAIAQDTAADLIRLLLTKPALHGVIWNQWSDADPHEFPNSGLVDAAGGAKPLLETLASLRRRHLS